MRLTKLLPTVFATSAMMSALGAQEPRIVRIGPGTTIEPGRFNLMTADQPRAVIGLSTTSSSTTRDTLGVLVSSVHTGSPAEKAGIEEGNRISSINGVSLKLAAADVGDDAMAGAMSRRLSRELDKLKPGDDVDLRVYAGGATKTIKVKTLAPDDLYASRMPRAWNERATLGLNLAVTGSARDSIGVFVMSTEDGGPAAKAGIEEGSRIVSINGIETRNTRRADDDDYVMRTSGVNRLEREVSRLKAGDVADLRVYFNGQYKNVKVTAARIADMPHHKSSLTIMGGDNFMSIPPMSVNIDGARIDQEIRHAMETARSATSGALNGVGRALGRIGNRIDW